MIRGRGREIVRFALIVAVVVAGLAGAWRFLAPGYAAVVGSLASPAFRLVEAANDTTVDVRGDEIWILFSEDGRAPAPFTWFDRYAFFAVVPLVALFAATPGLRWRSRLARAGIGLAGLLAVHIVYLVASVELAYAAIGLRSIGDSAARMLGVGQTSVRILWEAAPIAIWAALTAGAWRRTLAGGQTSAGAGRDEHCGLTQRGRFARADGVLRYLIYEKEVTP